VIQPGIFRLVRAAAARVCLIAGVAAGMAASLSAFRARAPVVAPQTDLDAFMQQVLAHRDENWKKLQQYILDEREQIELRGPSRQPLWGEQRDYTWYIRDGYFIRSPLKFNGVTIGDAERRKYEADYLRRLKDREKRQQRAQASGGSEKPPETPEPAGAANEPPTVDGLIRQTRQPEFISSAYFLRFKFEEGKYALAGREQLEGRDVLRIEYYPARLFSHEQDRERRRQEAKQPATQQAVTAEVERMLNKVSVVTLWVDAVSHQIIKYTFANVDSNFFPAQWLVKVGELRASMTMSQPFPDVWLPRGVDVSASMILAAGQFDLRYALDYHDYRQADVKTKVRIGGDR
jgi:hypothetical protein